VPVTLVRDMMKQLKEGPMQICATPNIPKTDPRSLEEGFSPRPDPVAVASPRRKRGQAAGGQLGSGAGAATH